MNLLVFTQALDRQDPVLGFFHRSLEALAPRYEKLSVVALRIGEYSLPANVTVYSLGKERGTGTLTRVWRTLRYAVSLRHSYDAVFVHMNQEYVLLCGWLWKLLGKRVYLWRNHYAGSMLTDLALLFVAKVFCTSPDSYTAKSRKAVFMPAGIDTAFFTPDPAVKAEPHSILSVGRIAPSKRIDLLLEAAGKLPQPFSLTICGDALPKDAAYLKKLMEEGAGYGARFLPGVPHDTTRDLYRSHELFVNCSPSGMFDKTIFEALACGTLALCSNRTLEGKLDQRLLFSYGDAQSLVEKTSALFALPAAEVQALREKGRQFVLDHHSLAAWGKRVAEEMI